MVHAQPASSVPGNPRGSPVHRVGSACWIQNRHRLFIGTCANICQWGLRQGHSQISFRLLDAPGRMHAHFETGRSSRIARGRRGCPTVNTAVNRVHPNHACGSGRGYQTIRGRPRGDYSIRGPNSTPLMITWRRLSNSLHWVQRYGRTATYFLLAPTSWTQGATLADAPSILYGLIQLVMVISTSKPEAADSLTSTPSISTAHEIRSPSPEDYYYSGHAERLLHVWNPRRLATKPPRTQKSIYAASANHQNYGRVLNFRARAPRQRGTISAKPDVASSLMAHASLRWINSVIDSGCSWHVHHRREDVINIRPCRDTFRGVDNKLHRATCMGDLPAVVKNSNGKHVKILIRNVRVVPTLNDTLFSVDQFWEDSRVDTMFRDVRCVILPPTDKDPTRVRAQAWAEAWAQAWAEAWAQAWAEAWAQAWAEAWAQAWAEAWAQAWAEAWAQAWAEAWAQAWAEAWAQAWAEAWAQAWAEAWAQAWAEAWAQAWAEAWAQAWAEAWAQAWA